MPDRKYQRVVFWRAVNQPETVLLWTSPGKAGAQAWWILWSADTSQKPKHWFQRDMGVLSDGRLTSIKRKNAFTELFRPFRAGSYMFTIPRPALRSSLGYYISPFQGWALFKFDIELPDGILRNDALVLFLRNLCSWYSKLEICAGLIILRNKPYRLNS
jgi:hypothetical protein